MRELAGSRRYCSFNGFCTDLMSISPPDLLESFLHSESLAIRARGNTGMPLEQRAEERDILITDSVTDLLHAPVVAFQQAFRRGDTQLLEIGQWAISGSLLKAPDEIAQAHSRALRRCLERKWPVKVLVQPILRSGDRIVIVFGF